MNVMSHIQPTRMPFAEFQRQVQGADTRVLNSAMSLVIDGEERAVSLPIAEYRRLKRYDREVLRFEDFTEADIAALAVAEPPEESRLFDSEYRP